MDRVESWIGEFYLKHTAHCPREDWPDEDTEAESNFIDAWRHQFVTKGVERRFADLASLDLAGDPPRFLDQHLPAIVKLALEYRRRHDAEAAGSAPADTLEGAREASKSCPDCGGSGLAIRYIHPEHEGKLKAPLGSRVAMHCACPLGCFLHRGEPSGRGRIAWLGDFPEMLLGPVDWSPYPDNARCHDPEAWDSEAGCPIDERVAIGTPAELAAFCGSLASASRLPARTASEASRRLQERSLATRTLDRPSDARSPQGGPPGRFLEHAPGDDPVIARERPSSERSSSQPEQITIPEDFV